MLMQYVKVALKSVLPPPALKAWQRLRFAMEQRATAGRPLEDVFTDIYENATWSRDHAGRYHSGPGSMPHATERYERFVAGIVNRDSGVKRLVDVGCGDFQVSDRILARIDRPIQYVGLDIARNVVAYNQATHTREGVSFQHLDISTNEPPAGDIVTVREVFQHLSNGTIAAALANLRRRYRKAIITEAVPIAAVAPNLDIVSGYRTRDGLNSGVFLEQAPFNLTVIDRLEVAVSADTLLRTLVVLL